MLVGLPGWSFVVLVLFCYEAIFDVLFTYESRDR